MTLDRSIYLPPGSYGMAVHLRDTGISFEGGTIMRGNADMMISAGGTLALPFFNLVRWISFPFSFSGTLYYDTAQTGGGAGYGFFGAGCAGTLPVTNLNATSTPVIGTTLSVDLNNLPRNLAFLLTGLSRTTSSFGPLPLDMTAFGAPGCLARVSPDAPLLLVGAGNRATFRLPIPIDLSLLGVLAFQQAVVLDPGSNALGVVFSDAAGLLLGI